MTISDRKSHTDRLTQLDYNHVWHPFTPMRQWRDTPPLIIERGDGPYLVDTDGKRYIDGVSSLWCNVHGHCVPQIDQAVRDQLDKVAHTTLLGLASPPSIELAARLASLAPGNLNKVFYSDAGATAVEVAFKMAVGYWHHIGQPQRTKFIGLSGAYHGDTTGAMSVGFDPLLHQPFVSMVFDVHSFANTDPVRLPEGVRQRMKREGFTQCARCDGEPRCGLDAWPAQCATRNSLLKDHCIAELERLLEQIGHETAAIVIEPAMQGAAGMICQPPGFMAQVERLAREHGVLLIADEVAVGFGRTGAMFAVEHDQVQPDLLCVAKGLTGGYLPLAATLATDAIAAAFEGDQVESRHRTLYHGHTYTGNPLACAAALASLDLFEQNDLLAHIKASAELIDRKLAALGESLQVRDVRQRGVMVGIELCADRASATPFDPAKRVGAAVCQAMRPKGLIVRPLGDVVILMPIPGMAHEVLEQMLDIVVDTIKSFDFAGYCQ